VFPNVLRTSRAVRRRCFAREVPRSTNPLPARTSRARNRGRSVLGANRFPGPPADELHSGESWRAARRRSGVIRRPLWNARAAVPDSPRRPLYSLPRREARPSRPTTIVICFGSYKERCSPQPGNLPTDGCRASPVRRVRGLPEQLSGMNANPSPRPPPRWPVAQDVRACNNDLRLFLSPERSEFLQGPPQGLGRAV